MDSIILFGQKNTLAEYMILSSAGNRLPMLDKDLYDSWKSIMELYMQNREHERMILELVEHGLPADIYSLVNHHKVAKDLWERVQLLMQGTSLTKQEMVCKLYDAFDKFAYIKGESLHKYYLRFTQLINDMNIYKMKLDQFQVNTKFINSLPPEWSKFVTDVKLVKDLHTTNFDQLHAYLEQHKLHANEGRPNSYAAGTSGIRVNPSGTGGNYSGQQRVVKCFNCQGEGYMARQCLKPKRKRDATWFRDKVLLSIITHNAIYQANDLDVYDSDCDEISTTKAVHMANLFSNGSDVLFEVPHFDNTHNDMLNQSVQEMPYSEQIHLVNYPENEITSDSNIIPYSQYLLQTQNAAIQDTNSSAQQDAMILSVFEQLSHQVTNCNKVNKDNLMANETLSAELERYKERDKDAQFADFEKEINSLKQTLSEQLKEKESLTKTFNVFKNESKEKEARNIDKEIALEKKVKELDNIVCKMGQSAQTVHMITKPQVFYDNNLKQALGFQNPFYLKKAQQIRPMLYDGSVIAKETNVISITNSKETLMLEEESRSKMLLKQSDPMVLEKKVNIKPINYAELNRLSKDFGKRFVPQQELSDEQAFRLQTLHPHTDQSTSSPVKIEAPWELPKCLELEAKLIKLHNMVEKDEYNRLLKRFSKLEQHCISLELAMQINKEIFQKNNTPVNQTEPSFDQLFELNNLKAKLQAKDTTIEKLKANIKRLNKTSTTNNVKNDIDEIETINIELEHRVKN
ncbi:retrovirus-related pol polyprotein from transposon TNT 1-94 [Tanacetum coccineum]